MARTVRPELVPFQEYNAAKKEETWEERYALIREHFPRAVKLDWHVAFRDMDLWGRFVKDLLGKPEKDENPQQTRERLRRLMGNDYSYDPFPVAFNTLAGKRSLRHLASKLDVGSHRRIGHLKNGVVKPDLATIEKIAYGFGKDPSYFIEYRISYVLGALGDQMEMNPEMSVDLFRRLKKKMS